MLGLSRAVRILLAAQPIDMHNSIDGLCAIVRTGWKENLYSGSLFVFVSKRGDRVKILSWDNGGFVVTYKRLEQGRFRLPAFHDDALGAQLLGCRRRRAALRPPARADSPGGLRPPEPVNVDETAVG